MRLRSDMFVAAFIRHAQVLGLPAVQVQRGAAEAGAIFIEVDHLDGTVALFGPAMPSGDPDAARDRAFAPLAGGKRLTPDEARAIMARQSGYDPDLWLIALEDRSARRFAELPGFAALRSAMPD